MRVAEICPNCATYIDASCIIYSGSYLSQIDVAPLTSLDEILGDISNTFTSLSGTTNPSTIPKFRGQIYINTSTSQIWVGMGTSSINWALIGTLSTTTTTTTSA